MKTIIKSLVFTCLSLCLANTSFGADPAKDAAKEAEKAAEKAAELNHIAMVEGKVMVMKDGESAVLKEMVTLNDGTQVNPDGSYLEKAGGEKKLLQEGEAITWEGKVKKHDKIMKDIEKEKEKAAKDAAKK